MNFGDNVQLAFNTIRGNRLRTGLTVAIIAFGIMALVGIKTAITAMQQKFMESFSSMGANGFTIRYRDLNMHFGNDNSVQKQQKGQRKTRKSNMGKPITREQAEAFKQSFHFPARVCITIFGSRSGVVSYGNKKTNPTVRIMGSDENYVDQNGFTIAYGRAFNTLDVSSGRNVCLVGSDIAKKLFNNRQDGPLEQVIRVNDIPFRVVGVLAEKGASLGFSWDNLVVTPYRNTQRYFNNDPNASFAMQVKVSDIRNMEAAIGEATAAFRPIRRLSTTETDNFIIDKSDSFVELLLNNLSYLTGAAIVIGMITLIGAAIGLMNIMLVAVTERTKEIGLVKAIGGKQGNVRQQFLFEAILISLLGALFGVILGVLIGNSFSIFLNTGFVVPWNWVVLGIVICSIVGLLAGLYPAVKAARLNPIEALRYE